jgi:MFS family permease
MARIKTGLILTPATLAIVATSAGASRFARHHPQRWLIIAGFLVSAIGIILLLALVRAHSAVWTWIPGMLLLGAGLGVMVTSSVNVVQSSWPDADQGDISGLSRCLSNLGSSLGTALVGSVLVAVKLPAGKPFTAALTMLLVFTLIGLVLGVLIPREPVEAAPETKSDMEPATPSPTT